MVKCWCDKAEYLAEKFGEFSAAAIEAQDFGGTCLLPDRHDSAHEFTADDTVMIEFRVPWTLKGSGNVV